MKRTQEIRCLYCRACVIVDITSFEAPIANFCNSSGDTMANALAKKIINSYLSQENPSFALLVDGPWGVGKTRLLKDTANFETDESVLYVTLYDVHSAEAFDWSIVRAMQPWIDGKRGKLLRGAKGFMSGFTILGSSFDLGKIDLVEYALAKLPNTLIFDDLERCGLEHEQLSGLINKYVEHQKKRVILVANTEMVSNKDRFDITREKLIGRTVSVLPELDAALTSVWNEIPNGKGKDAMQARQVLIQTVFKDAKHSNLRLLLRAILEVASLMNAVTDEMLQFEDSTDLLIRTLMALHMAYHGGRINREHLQQRAEIIRIFRAQVDDDAQTTKHPLRLLQEDHTDCEIVLDNLNSVLNVELGVRLIADGYASEDVIRKNLLSTHRFTKSKDQPDWVRLKNWADEPYSEIEETIGRLKHKKSKYEVVDPGEILQVYDSEITIDSYSSTPDPRKIARDTWRYIEDLGSQNKIPPARPGNRSSFDYGFSYDGGIISYGGFGFEPDARARVLVSRLMKQMHASYERSILSVAEKLISYLENDTNKFIQEFEFSNENGNFHSTPILNHLPVAKFAKLLLGNFSNDRLAAREIAATLSRRRAGNANLLEKEVEWTASLEIELTNQARKESELLAAQVQVLIRRDLR